MEEDEEEKEKNPTHETLNTEEAIRWAGVSSEVRRTEIDENTYERFYLQLQDAYWAVQGEVSDKYNYGLVVLDCTKFKKTIVTKIAELINNFKNHLL